MDAKTGTKWAAIGLILAVGLIHLITAPDQFNDATYKGVLFLANAVGAVVAAYGVWQGAKWGWLLGVLVAGGAALAYVMSRTVGLPGLPVDPNWLEPLGVISVAAEVLFVAQATAMLRRRTAVAERVRVH